MRLFAGLTAAILGGSLLALHPAGSMSTESSSATPPPPIGVLGDSDSHSYQDEIFFPTGGEARGGSRRKSALQWTETLARLRQRELNLGPWDTWGTRQRYATLLNLVGIPARLPRKQDYRHNFAITGAGCEDLMQGPWRQAPRLLDVMNENPDSWRRGVVIIRIGTNDFGTEPSLDLIARNPDAVEVHSTIRNCLRLIQDAVDLILRKHPQTRFVLVGIFDNSNWAKYLDKWQSPEELKNIAVGLDRFDNGLKAFAASDPRLAFFDDRAWFAGHWGSRGSDGAPGYRTVNLDERWSVTNTAGDDPLNAVLADGHAGLVWNAMWAQELIALLNSRFTLGITPLERPELLQYLDSIAPPSR